MLPKRPLAPTFFFNRRILSNPMSVLEATDCEHIICAFGPIGPNCLPRGLRAHAFALSRLGLLSLECVSVEVFWLLTNESFKVIGPGSLPRCSSHRPPFSTGWSCSKPMSALEVVGRGQEILAFDPVGQKRSRRGFLHRPHFSAEGSCQFRCLILGVPGRGSKAKLPDRLGRGASQEAPCTDCFLQQQCSLKFGVCFWGDVFGA